MAENSNKVLLANYVRIVNMDSKAEDRVFESTVQVLCGYDPQGVNVKLIKGHGKENGFAEKNGERKNENSAENGQEEELVDFLVTKTTPLSKKREMHVLHTEDEVLFIRFSTKDYDKMFDDILSKVQNINNSVFLQRTEDSSASQYFQFYGYLSQQQNMMQDFVRTSTYQKAIHGNYSDFNGKIVLDVGAGSGILSFFAVQAGAAKVYAVEASNMAQYAQQLVDANGLSDRIEVIAGKIEEIELPQKVDIIVSEPMGYMLYNERMLETYLHAKKWLKPNGKMFPSRGDLHVAPFCDEALYMEQYNKANFWYQTSFHNVDLSSLRQAAMKEYFRQPIVDSFDIRICLAKSVRHVVDFLEADEFDLHNINIPLEFEMLETGTVHGLAFWFDVEFIGSTSQVWLSTSPTEPLTHWYQVRCLLQNPIFVKQGQVLTGHVMLVANKRQSYDVTMDVKLEGTQISSFNTLDLKNPYFRYTGGPISAPPGSTTQSPSEVYWQQLDTSAVNLLNGLGEVAIDQQQLLTSNLMTIGNQAQHLVQQLPPTQPNPYHNINPNIHTGSISSTGRNSNYPSSQYHHVVEASGSNKMVDDTRMLIEQSNRLGKNNVQLAEGQGTVTSTYSIDQPMLSAMQQMFSIHQQYPPANVKHFQPSTAPPSTPQLYFN